MSDPTHASTPNTHRVCAPNLTLGRAYCGRNNKRTDHWNNVTCRDCWAAHRADQAAHKP